MAAANPDDAFLYGDRIERWRGMIETKQAEHDRRLDGIEGTLGEIVQRVAGMAGKLAAYTLVGSVAGGGIVALVIRVAIGG